MVDESMRWLVANGRVDEAKAILQKACRTNQQDYDTVAAASGFSKWEQERHDGTGIQYTLTHSISYM